MLLNHKVYIGFEVFQVITFYRKIKQALILLFKVVNAPKTARSAVKDSVCPKENFPYGVNQFQTYYTPNCIESILTCKDICGKKCLNECKPVHHGCARGNLLENFMSCPMRPPMNDDKLEYVKYELVAEKSVKEGKQGYKKMDKTLVELSPEEFISKLKDDFPSYSQHEVESWYLNAVRNAAFSEGYMPNHAIAMVTDFAQNLVLEKKHAISEEYFHKTQVALAATVSKVSTPQTAGGDPTPHIISQITSSDDK